MSIAAQYPAGMSSPSKSRYHNQSARDFQGAKQNSALFDSHDDFYAYLDKNKIPPTHAQTQQQQGQQGRAALPPHRNPGPDQSRPPMTNAFPAGPRTGSSGRSRPPSYSGSRSEEMLVAKEEEAALLRQQGQNARRGSRPLSTSGPPQPTTGSPSPSSPMRPQAQNHPTSTDSVPPLGMSIERLKTPGLTDYVLRPLDQKVREYEEIMQQEQDKMTRLDESIRALLEQRSQAETRHSEAKGKHDDYCRQYQDVEKAMRGESPAQRQRAQRERERDREKERSNSFPEDDDDDDQAEERTIRQRMDSQQSLGRMSQKMNLKDRFRLSLFGDR
jgi:hypothetical protein